MKKVVEKAKPLKVCHVSVSLNTGGLERLLAGMAKHYDRARFKMDFVALSEEGRFADEIRGFGCKVINLGAGQGGANRWSMVRKLKRTFCLNQYDVVHTHNTFPHIYGTLAARLAKVPLVINTRHGQRAGHGWKSRFLFRLSARWVDRIVAVSQDAANLCIEDDRIDPKKVTVIWNGIDPSQFSFSGPAESLSAVTVGRLVPEKGLLTLIEAMRLALLQAPDLRLTVIGDGPLRSELQNLAVHCGVDHAIRFLGEMHDVSLLLAQHGFYISSSLSEGISLTLLEAMAVGLPVIATNVGGNAEVVADGKTGWLVPSEDVVKLSEQIVKTTRCTILWSKMGVEARKRVEDCFDIRRMVMDYQSLYKGLSESTAQ